MEDTVLYKSGWVCYKLHKQGAILYCEWYSNNGMVDSSFQDDIMVLCRLIQEHKVLYLLDDSRKVNYPIGPEIQEWIAETINPALAEAGVKKYALVIPEDMIAELSNEQIFDEMQGQGVSTKIGNFSSPEEALRWLSD
jgi:hypothetical protein